MNNNQYVNKKVKADLQCPFCGCCQIIKLSKNRKSVTCPSCKQKIFLGYAGKYKGELDKHGNYFHAYEPYNFKKINDDFRGIFR
ncbi:hypothetical protein ABNB56_07130 [Streptococcus iniae]|uniref:hypothetical protein n=1 Tax=Streptococcus iniae TaxID=1346 RepID=UPI000EFD26B2|nr:hypothetical protein [Streptococcus iniae]RMI79763.1 hypothetical protein DIX58_00775 [Streptococcus iniae]